MPATGAWFVALGFETWHTPGVSRAWRYEFADGSYLLVTDLGGYDLPLPGGPYAGLCLSSRDEPIASATCLCGTHELLGWMRRVARIKDRAGPKVSPARQLPNIEPTTEGEH